MKTWKEGYQELATRIREGADLKTLIKIVGPTEQELKGAQERIELANSLFARCNWSRTETNLTPEAKSARQQYNWLMDAQDRFESRYY